MLKQFFKNIIYRIFSIGMNEFQKNETINQRKLFSKNALFDNSITTGKNTRIINNAGIRERIILEGQSIILGEIQTMQHGGIVKVGKHVFIGEHTRIWSSVSIEIGERVLISHNVNIHDNNSHALDKELRHEEFKYVYENHKPFLHDNLPEKPIKIGDDVWIGFNVTILKGVTIGNGAIIGANSIITKDVPANAVVIGSDQKIIKVLD
jgi:acetyltransferase-like isoleucine patch superfamily enzyme